MVFFRFRVITAKDVGAQATIGDDATDSCYTIQVPFAGIFTVHELQDAGASALYRQVDVLAYIRHIGNDLKRFVAHVLRMRGGETDTHVRYGFGHEAKEGGEVDGFAILFEAIGVHVLTEEGHFLVTLGGEVEHFVEDAFHITASLTSTGIRNDAIMAEIVTTTHDAHKA